jgi:hypothetical protein
MIDSGDLFFVTRPRRIAALQKFRELPQIDQIILSGMRGEIPLDGQVRLEIFHGLSHVHAALPPFSI